MSEVAGCIDCILPFPKGDRVGSPPNSLPLAGKLGLSEGCQMLFLISRDYTLSSLNTASNLCL